MVGTRREQMTVRNDRDGRVFEGLHELRRRERKRNPYRVPSLESLARELILEGLARRKVIPVDSQ